MPTMKSRILKAVPSQKDLQEHREHCTVEPALLTAIGSARGRQIRILRGDNRIVLYTVVEDNHPEGVHVGLTGRRRLGCDDDFDGVLDPHARTRTSPTRPPSRPASSSNGSTTTAASEG